MRRLLPLALLAAFAAPAFAQTQAQAPATAPATLDASRTVATVNGEAIKEGEYLHRLEWFRPDPSSSFIGTPVGFQLLRQMISERMILQMAKTQGILPTAPEIDARYAALVKSDPNFKAQLAEVGQSEVDVKNDLMVQEAQFKLVTQGITITDLEVEKHYKDNPSEFRDPTKYKLRIVAVGDDATQEKVDAAIKAGRAFPDVAKEFSLDVTSRNNGGIYGEVPDSALSDAVRRAVEVTPVGSTSVWIKGAGSETRVKFFVEAVTPAKTVPLDADLRAVLRRRLMLDKGKVRNNVVKDLETATRTAKVTIAQPRFQQMYTQLLERAKGAQG